MSWLDDMKLALTRPISLLVLLPLILNACASTPSFYKGMGFAPIHEACLNGDLARVKKLIDEGADVDVRSQSADRELNGSTPLLLASAQAKGNIELCRYLVGKGANVNASTESGMTPLMTAALCEDARLCEFLVNNGADMNAHSIRRWSAPMIGDLSMDPYVVDFFQKYDASISRRERKAVDLTRPYSTYEAGMTCGEATFAATAADRNYKADEFTRSLLIISKRFNDGYRAGIAKALDRAKQQVYSEFLKNMAKVGRMVSGSLKGVGPVMGEK